MSAFAFDPWAALKTRLDRASPPNPANPPNPFPLPDPPPRLAGLAGLGGGIETNPKNEQSVKDVGPWLLLRLWSFGATVEADDDGTMTITPHASGRRIPGALRAAVRRHLGALAIWLGADSKRPAQWQERPR